MGGPNGLVKSFINVANPTGAEPVPKAALMNDTQNATINVQPGTTYLLRLANIGAFAGQYFWIEGHTFHIVEVDGVWTDAAEAEMIYIAAAQRYSVLLTTKNETDSNYAIVAAMDQDLFDKVPATLNPNVTSYLVYDAAAVLPQPTMMDSYEPFDDITLVPTDGLKLFEDPDQSIILDMQMANLGDGANYAFFNDVTYVKPKVPSLYTALSTSDFASNAIIYGVNTNAFVLGYQQVVEIVLNNHDPGKHPFHLHGHNFQAIARGEPESGDYNPDNTTFPAVPMRRDTFLVYPKGHIVLRFRSDNPGVWLFHCHIEWHVDVGLIATMIEAPLELQKTLTVPQNHYDACAAASPPAPSVGNAAARTTDLLNLEGANVSPAPLPGGFTARGIVALVFSCLAAFLGMASVVNYGMGELSSLELEHTKKRIATAGPEGVVGSESTGATAVEK